LPVLAGRSLPTRRDTLLADLELQCEVPSSFWDLFPSSRECQYFQAEHTNGLGASSLVSRAMFKDHEKAAQFHSADSLYSLIFCWLATRLKEKESKALSILLRYIIESRSQVVPTDQGYTQPKIPTSISQFREMFGAGSNSILSWIPRPTIHKIGNSHVYIKPSDCVRDLLAHGHRVGPLRVHDEYSQHANSPRGVDILDEAILHHGTTPDGEAAVLVLPGYLWIDDFDPHNVKTNRHSCCSCFFSLALPQKFIHSTSNTYLVGFGPSNQSHEEMIAKIGEDLATLVGPIPRKFYYSKWKKEVPVFVPVYSYIADRPAKAKVSHTMAGNSSYHACFGISGNLYSLANIIPSCASCLQRRLDTIALIDGQPPPCPNCADWHLIGLEYQAPEGYPLNPNGAPGELPIMLKVKHITFASLIASMKMAFVQASKTPAQGGWTVKESKLFMSCECVDGEWQKVILAAGKEMATTIRASGGDPTAIDDTLTPIPPTLRYPLVDIFSFFCTIMHQLFLGIMKGFFSEILPSWLKTRKKGTSFLRSVNSKLEKIRAMKLSWCKCETPNVARGTFGRYVSENWLALARFLLWFCANIDSHAATDVMYSDPEGIPVEQYSKKQARAWLVARRIAHNGTDDVPFLLKRIRESIQQPPLGVWPLIYEEEEQRAPIGLVDVMVQALVASNARIMSRGPITKEMAADTDRHIKLFLSYLDQFDKHRGRPGDVEEQSGPIKKDVIWLLKYTFVTMLKIPGDMLHFGSLRLMWDGSGMGEGVLPDLKTVTLSTSGENWSFNGADKFYQYRGLKRAGMTLMKSMLKQSDQYHGAMDDMLKSGVEIFQELDDTMDPSNPAVWSADEGHDDGKKRVYKEVYTYASLASALKAFASGEYPICIVRFKTRFDLGSKYAVILKGYQKMVGLLCHEFVFENNGASYFRWTLGVNELDVPYDWTKNGWEAKQAELLSVVDQYGLLLPLREANEQGISYYFMTSEWTEMLGDGSMGLPRVVGATY
jgi:hypothetical protein